MVPPSTLPGAEDTPWEGVGGDGLVQPVCGAEGIPSPCVEGLQYHALPSQAIGSLAKVVEGFDIHRKLECVAVARGISTSGDAVEDQGGSNEAVVLIIEASWLAQVCGRHPVVDFEDPSDSASVAVVHDLYHSEDSAFQGT